MQGDNWQQRACAEPVAKIEFRAFFIMFASSAEAKPMLASQRQGSELRQVCCVNSNKKKLFQGKSTRSKYAGRAMHTIWFLRAHYSSMHRSSCRISAICCMVPSKQAGDFAVRHADLPVLRS